MDTLHKKNDLKFTDSTYCLPYTVWEMFSGKCMNYMNRIDYSSLQCNQNETGMKGK